eukprot:767644-Hanusia_phi.AAC.3
MVTDFVIAAKQQLHVTCDLLDLEQRRNILFEHSLARLHDGIHAKITTCSGSKIAYWRISRLVDFQSSATPFLSPLLFSPHLSLLSSSPRPPLFALLSSPRLSSPRLSSPRLSSPLLSPHLTSPRLMVQDLSWSSSWSESSSAIFVCRQNNSNTAQVLPDMSQDAYLGRNCLAILTNMVMKLQQHQQSPDFSSGSSLQPASPVCRSEAYLPL